MRDHLVIIFILAMPALAVLGHDIYLAYNQTDIQSAERFFFSDLGWLWTEYSPETYNWVINNADAIVWNGFIDPLLDETAFFICIAPLSAFLFILIFMKIFGIGAYEGQGLFRSSGSKMKKGDFSFDKGKQVASKAKYKRK